MRVFVDSNIPMYVAGGEHANRAPSRWFLEQVRTGEVDACTSTEVLQEILYRYRSLGRLADGVRVYDFFVELCLEVLPVTLADTDRCRRLISSDPSVGVRDALHAAVMLNQRIVRIATFDKHFDRIEGVARFGLMK